MPDTVDTLMLDLLQWMGPNPRRYAEVLDVWRTSCPRLPVWETAEDRGFIARRHAPGGGLVSVSDAGAEHLRHHRPAAAAVLSIPDEALVAHQDVRQEPVVRDFG
jgi:hypothetical protein